MKSGKVLVSGLLVIVLSLAGTGMVFGMSGPHSGGVRIQQRVLDTTRCQLKDQDQIRDRDRLCDDQISSDQIKTKDRLYLRDQIRVCS